MALLLLIVSFIMYYTAPADYNVYFCWECLTVFIIDMILLMRHSFIKQPVSFNTFFLVSFFLVSYAYPVFIMPSGMTFAFDTYGMIDPRTINACTALCTVAISSYTFGYKYAHTEHGYIFNQFADAKIIAKKIIYPYWFSLILVFIILYFFFTTVQAVDIEVQAAPFLFVIFLICTVIYLVSKTLIIPNNRNRKLRSFISANILVLGASGLIIIIYSIIGDRLLIVELGLIIISVYSLFYRRIKLHHLLAIIIVGSVFMTVLMWTRGSDASLRYGNTDAFIVESGRQYSDNEAGIWGFTTDLSGRFQELSYGYDMTQKNGHTYALRIIPTIFSPIPFVSNIIGEALMGVSTSLTSAGRQIALHSGHNVGSHCVIDVYMPWGMAGVVLVFFLLGVLVSYIAKNVNKNIYYNVAYVVLIYQSVFITRGSLFDLYRSLVWALLIVYLIKGKSMNTSNAVSV